MVCGFFFFWFEAKPNSLVESRLVEKRGTADMKKKIEVMMKLTEV